MYNLSPFLSSHPGGWEVLVEYLGYDGTLAFRGVSHSRGAVLAMDKFVIGILPKEQRLGFTL